VTVEIMSGTHEGVYDSCIGPIAPTGTYVFWSPISIRTLDGDRFVDGFFEEDEVRPLKQLGVLAGTGYAAKRQHSPLAPERRAAD
jgi:hypothetical protein